MSSRTFRVADEATPFESPTEHLRAELDWLRLALEREIMRLKAANLLSSDPFRGLYLSDEQVEGTLREWDRPNGARTFAHGNFAQIDERMQAAQANIDACLATTIDSGFVPPLARLASLFHLSPVEWKILVVAVAVEFDLRFETLYSWARNDVTRRRPSVDLAVRLASADGDDAIAEIEALGERSALVRQQLIRIGDESQEKESSFLGRSIRPDDRIVRFLRGDDSIDRRLASFTARTQASRSWESLHLPPRLCVGLRNAFHFFPGAVLCLDGPRGAGKRSAVAALSATTGQQLLCADLAQAQGSGLMPDALLLLLQREALLGQSDLLLQNAQCLQNDGPLQEQFRSALDRLRPEPGCRLFLSGDGFWASAGREAAAPWQHFDFPVPPFADRALLWREALDATRCPVDASLDREWLASRFALTAGAIHKACASAARELALRGQPGAVCAMADLETAARSQSSHGLRRFARKVQAHGGWNTLVLPPHVARQLRDVCTAERHRHTVYSQWGFDRRLAAGKGLNVLFCGVSGTGKTMAAAILTQELGLDLYRVDLSIVVSKYIGETEKQLSQIFREAQSSNAVLLFDEADALFGKRSEVKDAHDRYANVEVAYLLQKMEEYEGIVILATNLRRNMDDAFTRRMHHIVEFPFPDAEHRERIWRGIIPEGAPLDADVDFGFLARQFELAGGNIRNIALAAAFLAADESDSIRMKHCVIATALELQKTGKLPSRSEFRDYYDLIRTRT